MIALKTFKYFIWDYCLTKIFEGFQKNFKLGNEHVINVKDLYVGQKLHKVVRGKFTFYNCQIITIYNPLTSPNIESGNGITFTYGFREKFGKSIYEPGRITLIVWDDDQHNGTPVEFVEFI